MQPSESFSVPRRALDVEDYIDILRRHKGWIFGPFLLTLVASVVGVHPWQRLVRLAAQEDLHEALVGIFTECLAQVALRQGAVRIVELVQRPHEFGLGQPTHLELEQRMRPLACEDRSHGRPELLERDTGRVLKRGERIEERRCQDASEVRDDRLESPFAHGWRTIR